jgi:hypothetical protein
MKTQMIIAVTALIVSVNSSLAIDTKVTKEERQKMAEMHTNMASCLQSERPMSDCKSEMMKSCKGMMEKSGCSMMGPGKMNGMMKGHGMMMGQEDETKTDKKDKE